MTYYIEFWLGADRIAEYDDVEYPSPDAAREHIDSLLRDMLADGSTDDWTGCRFAVATQDGRTVLQVPVLAAMSAIARRRSH
jgi:hypothetical protein